MVETGALRILAAVDASNAFTSTSGCLSLMLHHKLTFFTFNFFLFDLFYLYSHVTFLCFFSPRSVFVTSNVHPTFVRSESSAASVTREGYWIKEQRKSGTRHSFTSTYISLSSATTNRPDKQMLFIHVCLYTRSASCCSAVCRQKEKMNKGEKDHRQHVSCQTSLPLRGDFMAASTMPTSSWRLLGSWARPEANAARASAWRPRYCRATPWRK